MSNAINTMPVTAGDTIRYRTRGVSSQFGGKIPSKELIGTVTEGFHSMDGSYNCMWVEGQSELVTEHQVLEIITKKGGAAHGII